MSVRPGKVASRSVDHHHPCTSQKTTPLLNCSTATVSATLLSSVRSAKGRSRALLLLEEAKLLSGYEPRPVTREPPLETAAVTEASSL